MMILTEEKEHFIQVKNTYFIQGINAYTEAAKHLNKHELLR